METGTKKEKITVEKAYKALLSGNLLILLGVDKLLPHILVLFVLGWVNIFMNYKIEQAMAEVEKNKVTLENYRIYHAQKTCEFVGLDRLSTIEQLLIDNHSEVKAPEKPANIIK